MSICLSLVTISKKSIDNILDPKPDIILDIQCGEWTEFLLYKSWHAIHFMLTGRAYGGAPPLNFLFHGNGHAPEPSRILIPQDVFEINNAIKEISTDDFMKKYDPKKLTENDIYPNISGLWTWPENDPLREKFIKIKFDELKSALAFAASKTFGMVIIMY